MQPDPSPALIETFRRGVEHPLPDGLFDELALAVFRWQFETNPVYRRFAEGRARTPASVGSWRDVPAVPAAAFRALPLVSGGAERVERVFRTSGTTGGGTGRGEHHVARLDLYRESLLPSFRANLLPDHAVLPFLSLVPSPESLPDSSLSFMVGAARGAFGGEGSGWFADPDGGTDLPGLATALRNHETAARPVLLLGTAFAFVRWLEAAEGEGWRFRLAEGSRLMETGGFKGRSRTVPRAVLYQGLERHLGIPVASMVNEYGMTELLSQYYEPVLVPARGARVPAGAGAEEALAARRHLPPPWMRFQVLDPLSLAPVPEGEPGLLCHHDLANVHSVSAVLTEDVGVQVGEGLRLLGRFPGAEPRGCSLAMEDLHAAASG